MDIEKLKKRWWIFLILIPLVITYLVRLEPMRLVPLESSTESNVLNHYRSLVRAEIDKQLPNLPEGNKAQLAEQKFQELLKTENEQIKASIKQNTDALKSKLQYQSGKNTYAYLGDIDSYYWLRQSRNIIEKGTQCDITEDDVCYDSYTTAPNPLSKPIDYYPIVIAAVYKFLRIFNADMSLMQASFLTPLIFALAFTIPLFLLLRKIGGNFAAVIGAVLVNVNPYVLSRSLGSDNDIVNVFFQVIFLWLAIECFYADTLKKKTVWAAFVGASLSVYSLFWGGWWYLADLFILALIVKGGYIALQKWCSNKAIAMNDLKEPLKVLVFTLTSFLVIVAILFSLFHSPGELLNTITGQFGVFRFKAAANINYWPNVLTTVAEFNSIGIDSVISAFGESFFGIPLYLMAILGIIFLVFPTIKFINKNKLVFLAFVIVNVILYNIIKSSSSGTLVFLLMIPVLFGIFLHLRAKEKEEFHPDVVFLLTIIICLVTYFSLVGARFLFLMAVPVSIFAALFFDRIFKLLFSFARGIFPFPKIYISICIAILVFLFLISPVKRGFGTAQSYLPNVSDEWVETLEKIRDFSKPDAIINSWWDFGHWFKYFADRRVTLDGSSQNSPQLHWLGKLLLTSDENVSRGILRMLDCGGNNAFNAVNEEMNDTPYSIDIINKIIVEKKDKAARILEEHGFSAEETRKILPYSHCMPPENFLITSQDMIGKSGVWAHFGSWDFKKAYLSVVIGKIPEKELIRKYREDYNIAESTTQGWIQELRSLKEQSQINTWIAPWPGYQSGFVSCEKKEDTTICPYSRDETRLSIIVDFEQKEAYIQSPDGKRLYAGAAAFVHDNKFELIGHSGETFGLGVVAVKSGDNVQAIYMDPRLVGSMFTRLFFFEGVGLSSFEKFYDTNTVFGGRIITWKVKWDSV